MHKVIKANRTMDSGYCRIPLDPVVQEVPKKVGENPVKRDVESDGKAVRHAGEAADDIVAKASAKAQEIVQQANKEAEGIKKKAQAQGLEEARRQNEKERESMLSEAKEILASAGQVRESVIKSAEPQVVELSLQVAESLLERCLEVDKDLIKDIVAEAITLLAGEESILVKVNAADLSTCRQHKDFFKDLMTEEAGIKFLPAEDVERGSCIVQGQHALVESLLKERFRVLKDVLLKEAT